MQASLAIHSSRFIHAHRSRSDPASPCSRHNRLLGFPGTRRTDTLRSAGTYDFNVTVAPDLDIPGTLVITRDGYAYHMEATVEGESHAASGDSIEVTGNHVVLYLTAGEEGEPVVFHLDFAGAGFTGAVATSEGSIPITGTRRNP